MRHRRHPSRAASTTHWALAAVLFLPSLGRAADPVPVAIEVVPRSLTLDGPRDVRRVLVTGVAADGTRFDLSDLATIVPPGDGVVIDPAGFAHGSKDGTFLARIKADGKAVDLPIVVKNTTRTAPVSFVRDVMPALSRIGCNAGTCHGSAKGKKGFKLSLRGYDLDFDYAQLVDDLAGPIKV